MGIWLNPALSISQQSVKLLLLRQMDIFKHSEKLMTMTEESWQRHSNPWSVYTRFSCLPLLSLSIWSRESLGLYSLILLALSLFWTWYNPRAFHPPVHTDNWASAGTFGERIFSRRAEVDIPAHHLRAAKTLTLLSALGLPILFYGLFRLDIWAIICGNLAVIFPKLWFVDRMGWIYADMKETNPEFNSWFKPKSGAV
jgi:hypothetical protein